MILLDSGGQSSISFVLLKKNCFGTYVWEAATDVALVISGNNK